jgi:hypothetical protein
MHNYYQVVAGYYHSNIKHWMLTDNYWEVVRMCRCANFGCADEFLICKYADFRCADGFLMCGWGGFQMCGCFLIR